MSAVAKEVRSLLYVEDEENDVLLMRMAFAKEGIDPDLHIVEDGQAALDYLSGTGPYAERSRFPLPAAVLLDLNLPEIPGFDVLSWIRGHPDYRELPVVVFSSSTREEDKARARKLGASEFLAKPNNPARFRDVVRELHKRWLKPDGQGQGTAD